MFKKTISKVLIAALFLFSASYAAKAQKLNLNQTIPTDSAVVVGKLANGLTYYIRQNAKPKQKVQLRLVVDAGSILENKNQQGLAHFMEHMNFNGLKHFPKNDLVHYLQKIGVQFGADLNANTAWDRTYFILPIPTDNPTNIDSGFQIVADWSHNALITTKEVNEERHVIHEELRGDYQSANYRMMEKFLPPMLNNSRYAYRLPGGKDSIVLHCNPQLIRDFYHDWYHPDLQAVIVVGDISVKKAKAMIQKYFGSFKNPTKERKRTYYSVKPYTHPNAMIVTDSEATNYDFDMLFPAKKRKIEKTLGDYKNDLVKSIFEETLNRKLQELAQNATPPYTQASASTSGTFGAITLNNEGFEMDVTPVNNLKESIDSAIAELLRVKEYGFSENDIKITKKQILAAYKNAYSERNKTFSKDYVSEYVANFMRHEPIPSISEEYNYVKEMLPTITPKEVSDLAAKILSNSKNFFALVTGPTKGNIKLPTKDELLKTVEDAFKQKVSAPKTQKSETSLLATQPKAGKIVSTKKNAKLGTTTYTLSNGIEVTVKPTNFKSDEIVLTGVKYGGSNLYGIADKADAHYLTTIISIMGYGKFTPTALSNFLSGKTVSLSTSMGAASNTVSGSSSVNDFETLMKLNYLKLTEPRLDTSLFKGFATKMKTQLMFIKSNPQAAFIDTLFKAYYNNSPLAPIRIPSQKDLNSINPKRCIAMYKEQFGNAKGFHFFLVGNTAEVKNLKALIEKYIGGLPTKGAAPKFKDNGLRPIAGKKDFKFYKGSDNKSLFLAFFHGDNIKYSDELNLKASLLGQQMTMDILDTMREKLQYIYSGGMQTSVEDVPYPHYTFVAILPCGPKNAGKISTELNKEVKGFLTYGGPKGYLEKAKKATLEKHKDNIKKNSYWAGKLEDILFWGHSQSFFLNFDKEVNAITNKDIIQTANKLLKGNEFTAVSFPKKDKK